MPLRLVTGPANAEKAEVVLNALRESSVGGHSPILVVPTAADVDAYRRQLADGFGLGLQIERFQGLQRRMAERSGITERPASELLTALAARSASLALAEAGRLGPLAGSAVTSGFADALCELAAELGERGVGPREFAAVTARWAAARPARQGYADDLAALYGAYSERIERVGALDPSTYSRAVCDALRADPSLWEATPVLLYGFDDFTDPQLDAVEAIAAGGDSPVTVSLPYDEGRLAFAGRERAFARLSAVASEVESLPAIEPDADAPVRRRTLFQLERALFDAAAEPAALDAADAAVELLVGGDERAEIELVAERIQRLHHKEGFAWDEIALALRDVRGSGPLVAEVFTAAGIPFSLERWVRAGETSTGRALVALLRCAAGSGSADDLLVWLRAPGVVRRGGLTDALESKLRQQGIDNADGARAVWEEMVPGFPLEAIDQTRAALSESGDALYADLAAKARRLVRAPWQGDEAGEAPIFGPERELDARAAAALIAQLDALAVLVERDAQLAPRIADLEALLAAVEVRSGDGALPGAVRVASPLEIRARRIRALFLCRLIEGVFPQTTGRSSLLPDAVRSELALTAGLPLLQHETTLEQERYLLYAAVSRPTELLVFSWASSGEDGSERLVSPFVDDLRAAIFPWPEPRERERGSLGWEDGDLVSARQAAVAEALALPPLDAPARVFSSPAVLERLAAIESFSPTTLERYMSCPVRWMVESLLRPEGLEAEDQPRARGRIVHFALEAAYTGLNQPLSGATLDDAVARAAAAVELKESTEPLANDPDRRIARCARVVADITRYLEAEAQQENNFAAKELELGFGGEAELAEADLGEGLRLRGRIDRVDHEGGKALVIDYKGRSAQVAWGKWVEQRNIQAALYALAYAKLFDGVDVVGAVYQPIGGVGDASGFALEDSGVAGASKASVITESERDELLEQIRLQALEAARAIRAGEIEPRPVSCTRDGTCAHPAVCRSLR
ncbi:MAG: exodeoxyribonuclease V subunit gamma [Solirubrobacteraceae bacterium]|nr:exodeoxyribonuclease V subunit gamma [Solirubrobacteraceae bacterium]MDP4920409.1 exodeoxyribonuclease V subunit gamma [Solirubrobacteraceae bacterium]